MAVIKAINSKASLAKAINYVTQKQKTEEHLVSGIDCVPKNAINEMKFTKEHWNKTEGRQYMHLTQSFKADEKITPEQAHKIACNLFKDQFKGHEKLIVTHIDKDHIHSHIIVNSVNFENGKKLQQSKKDLQHLKDRSDQLCKEQGLEITKKSKEVATYDIGKYKAIEKGAEGKYKSYVLNTALDINKTKEIAKSKNEFVELMNNQGYKVDWQENRKYITFTDKDGNKVRNSNIEKTFKIECGKEQLINEFARNSEQSRGPGEQNQQLDRAFERNNRTKRADEELHQSSYERGDSQRSNNKQGIAEDRGHEQNNSRENDFDIKQARRNVEELQRGTSRAFGEWQERDSNQQSKDTTANEPNRADNEKQLSRNKGANSRGLERSRVADFEIDF